MLHQTLAMAGISGTHPITKGDGQAELGVVQNHAKQKELNINAAACTCLCGVETSI